MHLLCWFLFINFNAIITISVIEKQRAMANPIDARVKNVTLIIGIGKYCFALKGDKFLN